MFKIDNRPLNYFDNKKGEEKKEDFKFDSFNKKIPNFKNKDISIKKVDIKKRKNIVEEISLKKNNKKNKGLF